MMKCSFHLNRRYFTKLIIGDTIRVTAYSGKGPHRNNPDSVSEVGKGPLPTGHYYIVDRKSGGRLGWLWDWKSGRDKWFALYRADESLDDRTFIESVERGLFRLHPSGPEGRSDGCVTVQFPQEYDKVREHLIKNGASKVPNSQIMAYGILSLEVPEALTWSPKFPPV